ncbi:Multiple stress resistance protein BhsA precursor [Serratia plymuthica]|nr:Multiple stress resistance protein BhsA precursor [Serratia plymuthica]VEI17729.1 Multiple stress resistance protein BhsA precursor [Serratia plymuthica]
MKNLKMTLAAIALASVSFGSFAAELVNAQPSDLQKTGVITVSGASDLTSLENKLAAKADEAGAKSFQIISTTGDNKLHGTAIIYN